MYTLAHLLKTLSLSRRANKKYGGFTLVELIIIIGILALLSTIGILSMSNFNANSRDATRVEDLSNIQKGLGIAQTINGKFPLADNGIQVLSGGTLIQTQ